MTSRQYGITVLISLTSFHGEIVSGAAEGHLFSQATLPVLLGWGGDPLFGLSEDISLNRMWSLCEVYLLTKDSARLQVTRCLRLGVMFI